MLIFHSGANTSFFCAVRRWLAAMLFLLPGFAHAQTAWVQSRRAGTEMQFLFANKIQRYDLSAKTWLGPITLPRTGATSFTADATGAFVAYGRNIYRYTPQFTGETAAGSASTIVQSLFLDGQLLIAVHPADNPLAGRLTCFNRATAAQLSTVSSTSYPFSAASHAPAFHKIIGRNVGSLGQFVSISYTPEGILSPITSTEGEYKPVSRTFIFPDEARLMDSDGRVFRTSDLTFMRDIPFKVTSVDWNGGVPVVLSGADLISYSPGDMLETARLKLPAAGQELAVNAGEAFVFAAGSDRPVVTIVPLSDLKAPAPGAPLDPAGLAYQVDDSFVDKNGNLLFFSREKRSLFRWSPALAAYLPTIPLEGEPGNVACLSAQNTVYTSYPSRFVRKLDLSAAAPVEVPFLSLLDAPTGLAGAGDFLYTCYLASYSVAVYKADGSPAGPTARIAPTASQNTWDPVRNRMYHFQDNMTPSYLSYHSLSTNGAVTGKAEWPYHGDYPSLWPIRVRPDGNRVLTGGGNIFKADDLTWETTLGTTITDALWKDGTLFTIRAKDGSTEIQSWSGPKSDQGSAPTRLNGTPLRIFPTATGTVVVSMVNGAPRFAKFTGLDLTYLSPAAPLAAADLVVSSRSADSVSLKWNDVSDNEDNFQLEYRLAGSSQAWLKSIVYPAGSTAGTVPNLAANTAYEFRVTASQGTLGTPSAVIASTTLASGDQPIGEPYHLAVTQIFSNRITLSWTDNAVNETGFRILRSTSPGGAAVTLTAPPNATSWTDTGLNSNTLFYYRLQAVNGAVTGDLSAQVSARTLTGAAVPKAPDNFKITTIGSSSVSVSWRDNSTDEDQFIVETSTTPFTSWTERARLAFNTTSTVITGLVPNIYYSIRVRAVNGTGTSTDESLQFTTLRLGGKFQGSAGRAGSIYYFVFWEPNRIERYDLVNRVWLSPWTTEAPTTGLQAEESAIFTAEGADIYRWSPDGATKTPLFKAPGSVSVLATLGDNLFYNRNDFKVGMINKNTGVARPLITLSYPVTGAFVDPVMKLVYLRTLDNIYTVGVSADGASATLNGNIIDDGDGLYPFPTGTRVASGSGKLYTTDRLSAIGSLGTSFRDLVFQGPESPIVLRPDSVTAYTSTLRETATVTFDSNTARRVALEGGDAIAFLADGASEHGMSLRVVPLTALNAPLPDAPLNLTGQPYTVDDVLVDQRGLIYLYSRAFQKLLPWSPVLHSYQEPLSLKASPSSLSYSEVADSIFTGYGNGAVRKLSLASSPAQETDFGQVKNPVDSLIAAGEYIAAEASGLGTGKVFRQNGSVAFPTAPFAAYSSTWDPVRRRIYFFPAGISPSMLSFLTLGADGKETFNGQTLNSDYTPGRPIRVSPDGAYIAIGGGVVFKADDLSKAIAFPTTITDALWLGNTLHTIRLLNGATRMQSYQAPQFSTPVAHLFPGEPLRIVKTPEGIVVITSVDGVPSFTILNDSLTTVYSSPVKPVSPGSPASTSRTASSVSLTWADLSSDEDGFLVEYRQVGPSSAWFPGVTAAAGATSGTVSGLLPGTAYEFRVRSTKGDLKSDPSALLAVSTVDASGVPAGEPYNLAAVRIFYNSVTLSWDDNAANETAFNLLRSTTPGGATVTLTVPASTTSWTDTGLLANSPYYYRIQAVNGPLIGDLSSQISVRTPASAAAPAGASDVVISDIATTSLSIAWKDNSTNEDGFVIEYMSATQPVFVEAGLAPYNTTSFKVTGLSPNTRYTFRVRAVNNIGGTASIGADATTLSLGGDFLNFAVRNQDVYYFAFSSPNRIERYDLINGVWLTALPVPSALTALWVDDENIYSGEGRGLYRWNKNGTSRSLLLTAEKDITLLATIGELLAFQHLPSDTATWSTANKRTGAILSASLNLRSGYALVLDPVRQRLFLSSDAGLVYYDFAQDGTISGTGGYRGGLIMPHGQRPMLFPSGGRVAEETGRIYSADSLSYSTWLGGFITDLDFRGNDVPIVLRGNMLEAYTNTLVKTGAAALSGDTGRRVAVSGSNAIVFHADGANTHGFTPQAVPLSALEAPAPNLLMSARDLPFNIDNAFLDWQGLLYIQSKEQAGIFTWSPDSRSYLNPIPLSSTPDQLAYADRINNIYMGYSNRTVRKIELSFAVEKDYLKLETDLAGLAGTDYFPYVSEFGGNRTFSPSGQPLSFAGDTNRYSGVNTWDSVNRRIYHFRDGGTPATLLYEDISTDGKITSGGEFTSPGLMEFKAPIRVRPDGAQVVLGSGVVLSAPALTLQGTLPHEPVDAAWLNGQLITLEPVGASATRVQRYNADFTRGAFTVLSGKPVRIFELVQERMVVITQPASGIPRFHLLNGELAETYDSSLSPEAPVILTQPESLRVPFGGTIRLTADVTGSAPLLFQWYRGDRALPGAVSSTLMLENAGSGEAGAYTVKITNALGSVSSSTAVVAVGPTLVPPFTEGNLLVSSAGNIYEFTPQGSAGRTLPGPLPPEAATRYSWDAVVDRLGILHVLSGNSTSFYLCSYDSDTGSWSYTVLPDQVRGGTLAVAGDWVITTSAGIHITTHQERRLPVDFQPVYVSTGPDGNAYGISSMGDVRRFSTSSWSWAPVSNLSPAQFFNGLGIGAEGMIFTGDAAANLLSFSPGGQLLRTLPTGTAGGGGFFDISVSPDGRIAVAQADRSIGLASAAGEDLSRIIPPRLDAGEIFTEWMPAIMQPAPVFAESAPPAATEDVPWSWTPVLTHPDPDASGITLTAVRIPAWMSLSGGRLSGTPLQADTGDNVIVLSAGDSNGHTTRQTFTLGVVEVNDNPVATSLSLARLEDASTETIDLSTLFMDEETPENALEYTVLSNTGGVVSSLIDTDSPESLRIAYLPNAFGSAVVTVRATDAGGLFADSVIILQVAPVNDPPVGTLPDMVIDEDADPVVIDLAASFEDVETPSDALHFTAVSSAPELAVATISGTRLTLSPQKDANGQTAVKVTCADADGGVLDVVFNLTINPVNDAPAVQPVLPDISAGAAAADALLNFAPFVSDPDAGDVLTWRVVSQSNPGLFSAMEFDARGRLKIQYAPYVSGQSLVTVEVSDAAGVKVQRSFNIDLPALPPPSITAKSALTLNRQTGLWEQRLTVRNDGQRAVGGFEITVTGLPPNATLYNASGVTGAGFTAGYYQPVGVGESVNLLLEYYSPNRSALNPVLSAATVLPLPHASPAAGTPIEISRTLMLEPGAFLLEFEAVPGDLYQIQYGDGSTWTDSLPRLRAAGTRVQWIDRGAPRTTSAPSPGQSRFYRVKHLTGTLK